EDLFFETSGEFFGVWEAVKPVVPTFRERFVNKQILANLEQAAKRYEAWSEQRNPGHITAMRQFMQQMRGQAASAAKARFERQFKLMYGRDAPGSRGRPAFFATRGTCLVSVNRPSGLFLSHSHGFTNCNVLSSIALRIQRIKVIALNLRTELCLSHPQSESESCTPCLEP